MTVRSIFLFAPAETAKMARGPVPYAMSLARQHGASLTAFTVAVDVTSPGPPANAAAKATSIAQLAHECGVECRVVTEHSHAIGLHEVVAEHARVHDMSVIGTGGGAVLTERLMAEHLMFESGRPVLLVPADHKVPFTASAAAVAWDNTPAAARALGDAISVIGITEAQFLTIDGEKQLRGDQDQAEFQAAVARRGIAARFANAPLAGRQIADALQQEAAASGAELLVMGAFGHSRLRRFMLGSATSGILQSAHMPALLAH